MQYLSTTANCYANHLNYWTTEDELTFEIRMFVVDATPGEGRWTLRWEAGIVFARQSWMFCCVAFGWNDEGPSLIGQIWEDVLVVVVAELWLILREVAYWILDICRASHWYSIDKLPTQRVASNSIPGKQKFVNAHKSIISDKTSVSIKADRRASVFNDRIETSPQFISGMLRIIDF